MSKRIILISIVVAVVFLIAALYLNTHSKRGVTAAPGKGVETTKKLEWFDYDTGLLKASKDKKPIVIIFHADWCHFCKKMDNKTLSDKSVRDYLNKNFIVIKIDTQKDKKTASSYQVMGLPTTWFLESDATRIGPLSGYIPPDQFIGILRYIGGKHYKNMSLKDFLKKGRGM